MEEEKARDEGVWGFLGCSGVVLGLGAKRLPCWLTRRERAALGVVIWSFLRGCCVWYTHVTAGRETAEIPVNVW
jgi:hypothetical protein